MDLAYGRKQRMYNVGKTAANAIAAMSYLAEHCLEEGSVAGSQHIAKVRNLPKPLVAKLLNILSTGGLVNGTPGPGGGYRLAKPPKEIRLIDIVDLFERSERNLACPFGPNYCGSGEPCPLHDKLVALNEEMTRFLTKTTLAVFTEERRGKMKRKK